MNTDYLFWNVVVLSFELRSFGEPRILQIDRIRVWWFREETPISSTDLYTDGHGLFLFVVGF